MSHHYLLPLLAALFSTAAASAAPPSPPSAELRQALAIGDEFLATLSVDSGAYKLVGAQNMLNGNEYKDPAFWRLTYKSCGNRSANVEPVCKGGELFIGVDLNTAKATFIGAGE